MTASEQLSKSDVAVVAVWVTGSPAKDNVPATTTFEVEKVIKGSDTLHKKMRFTLTYFEKGEVGDRFVFLGTSNEKLEWTILTKVTEGVLDYILSAPGEEISADVRLRYFLGFLEHENLTIAADAFAEFANSDYSDIAKLAKDLSRDKLRKWVADSALPPGRIGLYGMLMGLCGEATDVEFLSHKIQHHRRGEFRIGGDGVIAGYLMLTGTEGLPLVDRIMLNNRPATFRETLAAMQALRFMWTYRPHQIDKTRLRQSMRYALNNPQVADLAIADLARWQDWEIRVKLMELYEGDYHNAPSIKRSIIRFLIAEIKSLPENHVGGRPQHVIQAEICLQKLRQLDPKLVTDAIRYANETDIPLSP